MLPRQLLLESFKAAVTAADPLCLIDGGLVLPDAERTVVVGGGKAAASMAAALERAFPHRNFEGLVVTRYQHGMATRAIKVIEAGHPVPDRAGADAAQRMLGLAAELEAGDLLLVLMSGGASALMSCPAPGLTLEDLALMNRELLRSGAPITAMNIIRKHVSSIAGGRLAAATKARVLCLIISDVTGDDPSAIGSGPCAPDASSFADSLSLVAKYGVRLPAAIAEHLQAGRHGFRPETPKPGSAIFERVENRVIAAPHASLQAAAAHFNAHGVASAILGDTVTGEARHVAGVYGALVREIKRHQAPFRTPVALISGGECTVTMAHAQGTGRGGRCSEFLLALGTELEGLDGVHALACDTDGIDGSEDNAGAVLTPDSLARAAALGLDAHAFLDRNDAYSFFELLGDLVVTGPTRTNVNDYRVILVS